MRGRHVNCTFITKLVVNFPPEQTRTLGGAPQWGRVWESKNTNSS